MDCELVYIHFPCTILDQHPDIFQVYDSSILSSSSFNRMK
jgi:hypothetical protein